jgi:RHS repeat-associated protein
VLARSGDSGTVYGITGEQYDENTGLLYLRARYLNLSIMTFMSRDPWQGTGLRPGTLHAYLYVESNPVNYTDPSGHCAFFVIDTLICLGAGIGFISSMTVQTINNMQAGMPLHARCPKRANFPD